jgi:hypothetical protein
MSGGTWLSRQEPNVGENSRNGLAELLPWPSKASLPTQVCTPGDLTAGHGKRPPVATRSASFGASFSRSKDEQGLKREPFRAPHQFREP